MQKESLRRIEEFVQNNPITSNETTVYNVTGEGRWTILAPTEHLVKALDILLTTEHAILSNISVDTSGKRYVVALPYAMGVIRSGVYTYNAEKNVLE